MSQILVDTHALLWWLADDDALSADAHDAIADPANEPLVSVATVWELAIKLRLGKLEAPDSLPETVVEQGFLWLGIAPDHAWGVTTLPDHHRDPFDRLLVSQAISERVPIVSADEQLAPYEVEIIW